MMKTEIIPAVETIMHMDQKGSGVFISLDGV